MATILSLPIQTLRNRNRTVLAMATCCVGVIFTLSCAAAFNFACVAIANEPDVPKAVSPAGEFDDAPTTLVPKQPRSAAERDKLEATALFSSGRTLEQNKEYETALRKYQRAVRLDPNAVTILREIMPLSFTLNRQAEAVRYAAKVVEQDPSDPLLALQIGRYLTAESGIARALKIYEKALEAQEKTPDSAVKTRLWMEIGRLHFLDKEYKPAADAFAKVKSALDDPKKYGLDAAARKELLGEDGFAYELFGECFLESERYADALSAYEKLNKAAPNNGVFAFHKARVLAKEKKSAEALASLQTYFDSRETSRSISPYELLAEILKQSNQEGKLLEQLEKQYENNADNLPLAAFLARSYVAANKPEKAEPIWQRVLNKQAVAEAYEGLAEVYHVTKQVEPLWKHLAVVVAKTNSLDGIGKDRKKAIATDTTLMTSLVDLARQKLKDKPDSVDGDQRQAVGLLALEAKQYEVAAEFFESALSYKPRKNPAELLLLWGLELFAAERFDEAIKVLQRGVDEKALPEDNPAFYYYLAGALEFAGKTDDALHAARETIKRKPKAPRFASRLPWIYYHAKRQDEAFKAYVDFVNEYDDDFQNEETRDVLREARLSLSNICVLRHDLPAAEEWLEQVLDEFPDDFGALNDLGYLWADANKKLHRALPMVQAAVTSEPKNFAYRDSLGWVYHRLGRNEEALKELLQAIPDKEPDATVFEHLGDVCDKLAKKSDAADYWRKSIGVLEKTPEAQSPDQNKIKELKSKIAASETTAGQ